jgi:hypothetical protein
VVATAVVVVGVVVVVEGIIIIIIIIPFDGVPTAKTVKNTKGAGKESEFISTLYRLSN